MMINQKLTICPPKYRSESRSLEYPALSVAAVRFPNLDIVAVVDVVAVVVDDIVAVDRRLNCICTVGVPHKIPALGPCAVVGPKMDIVTVKRT